MQSSSVSSDLATAPTIPPKIPPITHLPQTPTPALTTEATTTLILVLLDFSSLFGFDQRVSVLEKELSQFKQVDYSAQLLETIKSQIPAMVDSQLSIRLEDSIQKAFRSYTTEFEKKSQGEKKRYIDPVEKSVKDIIKDEVKSQLPQIIPKEVSDYATPVIQSTITESLENFILAKSSSQPKSTYEASTSLIEFELKKILLDKMQKTKESVFEVADTDMPQNQRSDLANTYDQPNVEDAPKSDCKIAQAEKPPLSFDEQMSTPIEFLAYVMNHLKIDKLTQEHLVGPTFNLLKGTCKSHVELEYNSEECYKVLTDRLDWNNPEGKEYPFDLSKPLPLIKDRGRQVVPVNYFINNNLEYLKGGSSSRKYTTSTTKTKDAKYDNIQGIDDMVLSVSKYDVYSTKRIIAVTKVKVMKWYDYGYLEEIEVRRED
ncbi:hypothetical protein Tco_1174858 [Tanacetum coccineum]